MKPAPVDLDVYQGDRAELFFRARDQVWDDVLKTYVDGSYIDLTGKTARAQVRDTTGLLACEFDCIIPDQTTSPGSVLCVLTPTKTAALDPAKKYVYDVELSTDVDHVDTYIAGKITMTGDVTRAN